MSKISEIVIEAGEDNVGKGGNGGNLYLDGKFPVGGDNFAGGKGGSGDPPGLPGDVIFKFDGTEVLRIKGTGEGAIIGQTGSTTDAIAVLNSLKMWLGDGQYCKPITVSDPNGNTMMKISPDGFEFMGHELTSEWDPTIPFVFLALRNWINSTKAQFLPAKGNGKMGSFTEIEVPEKAKG